MKLEAKYVFDQSSTGKTVVIFKDFIVDRDMVFQKQDKLNYKKKTDYKVTITEIAGLSEIKDYSEIFTCTASKIILEIHFLWQMI